MQKETMVPEANRADRRRPLTIAQILLWVDRWRERTGTWPKVTSGPIPEAEGEVWQNIHAALRIGLRGLPGGSSLAKLLDEYRHTTRAVHQVRTPLSVDLILAWADSLRQRTGRWPNGRSGDIPESPGDTWENVARLLVKGGRGLAGGQSLARLLHKERQAPVRARLALPEILVWADSHHARTGSWPTAVSGSIPECPHETWKKVDAALRLGLRGRLGVRPSSGAPVMLVGPAQDFVHRQRPTLWPAGTTRKSPLFVEQPGQRTALRQSDLLSARHISRGTAFLADSSCSPRRSRY